MKINAPPAALGALEISLHEGVLRNVDIFMSALVTAT